MQPMMLMLGLQLSTFDNVITRGNNEYVKAASISAIFGGGARSSHRFEFITGLSLTEKGRNGVAVCK